VHKFKTTLILCCTSIVCGILAFSTSSVSASSMPSTLRLNTLSSDESQLTNKHQQSDDTADTIELIEQIQSQPPTLDLTFEEEDGILFTGSNESASHLYESGKYIIDILKESYVGGTYVARGMEDFLIEINTERTDGSTEYSQGFVFRRSDDDNLYRFWVNSNGTFSLDKFVGNEENLLLDDTIESYSSSRWKRTKLGLLVQGSKITMLVDDQIMAQVNDASLAEGDLALVAKSSSDGPVQISFDNLKMWDLSDDSAESDATQDSNTDADRGEHSDKASLIAEIRELDPTLYFDFTTDMDGRWSEYEVEGAISKVDNGRYILGRNEESLTAWQEAEFVAGDFLAEFDANLKGETPGQAYGLFFRYIDPSNFYRYRVSGIGTYSVDKMMNDEWYNIIPWTESPVIKRGLDKTNRLGVMAIDSEFILTVNGEVLSSFEDDSLEFGDIALTISSFEEPNVSVAFDNLTYWNLQSLDARLLISGLDITDLSLSTLLELGDEYYRSNHNEDALALFNQALRFDPSSVEALVGRGNALRLDDDEAGALRDFEKALEIDSDYAPAYRGLAFLANGDGNTEAALQYIESAIESDRSYAFAYYTKGYIYNGQGNIEAALANYDRAIDLDQNNSNLHAYRGSFYADQQNWIAASGDITRAIQLNPFSSYAYYEKSISLLNEIFFTSPDNAYEKNEAALKYINKAIAISPNRSHYYATRGAAFFEMGDFDKAITNYEKSITMGYETAYSYQYLGFSYEEKGQYRAALNNFKKSIRLEPDNRSVSFGIARAYDELNQRQDAYDAYLQFLDSDRRDSWFTRHACDRANSLHLSVNGLLSVFSRAPCTRFPQEYSPSQPDYTQGGQDQNCQSWDENCDGQLSSYERAAAGTR